MTWFLLKGLLRDHHRSLFPIIVVSGGVMITILIHCWALGVVGDITTTNAKIDTGHIKIMTRAYADIASQLPNDLSLLGVSKLLSELKRDYPDIDWAPRIKFGGLLDIPDENGETRAQGPVFGIAIDLFSPESNEKHRLNLESAIVQGRLPRSPGEIVVSEQFAKILGVNLGETATLIGATSTGSMAIYNFTLVGTIHFGIRAMDKGAMFADISDIQYALDMEDRAGEILGFLPNMIYNEHETERIATSFNAKYQTSNDEFAPMMLMLREQNGLGEYLDMVNAWIFAYVVGFVLVMSIVLWNTGLMSGIRRYGEMGIRLAIGEAKGHVYRTLIYESVLIGVIGSIIGTALGLAVSYYLQEHGIDMTDILQGSTMLISTVLRARITSAVFYIGFIPGLLATTLGAMISGIGIFKRQTSQLFKELEA
jgi:putative ABC transport system permease protein